MMAKYMPTVLPEIGAAEDSKVPLALVAAVFLASYLSWRPSLDILFTTSDALFLLGSCQLTLRRRIPLEPFGALTPLWLGAFVAMMTGLLVSSLSCSDPSRWLVVASQYAFAWVVLPFLLLGHDRAYTLSLTKALLFGLVVMELIGEIVYFTYQGSFQQARSLLGLDFVSGSGRLGVFATDANWNGAAISMALPFSFYLRSQRLIGPVLASVSIAILMFGLLLTASFTAFASTCVAVIIFAVAASVRPRLSIIVPIAILAFVAVQTQIGLPGVFQKRVATAIETGDMSEAGTFDGRVVLMRDAWRMVGDHMLVGIGVDQDRIVSQLKAPVHNMYLLVWVEGGLVALAGWVCMVGVFMATALVAFRHNRLAGALAASVMTTFLMFSTASPHMYARLWAVPVLLALAVARSAVDDPGSRYRRRGSKMVPSQRALQS
jgi:O-antigen ligase